MDVDENGAVTWTDLPNDCVGEILGRLSDPRDFAMIEQLERRTYELSKGLDRDLWGSRIASRFYPFAASPSPLPHDTPESLSRRLLLSQPSTSASSDSHPQPFRSFREIYQERHRIDRAFRNARFDEDFGVGHTGWINALRTLPNGAIATGGADHSLKLWGSSPGPDPGDESEGGDAASFLWDEGPSASMDKHSGAIWGLDATDSTIVSGGFGANVHVTDAATGQWLAELPPLTGVPGQPMCPFNNVVTGLHFRPEGHVFATGFIYGVLGLRDLRVGPSESPILAALVPKPATGEPRPRLFGCRFFNDHYLVAAGQGPLCVFDVRRAGGGGAVPSKYSMMGDPIAMAPSLSPLALCLGNIDGPLGGSTPHVFGMDVQGPHLATGNAVGTVDVWDLHGLASGRFTFAPPSRCLSPVYSTASGQGRVCEDSDAGAFLLASQVHTSARRLVWDAPDTQRQFTVFSVRLTEDGRVVSASEEGTVCLSALEGRTEEEAQEPEEEEGGRGLGRGQPSTQGAAAARSDRELQLRGALQQSRARDRLQLRKYAKVWPQASDRSVIRSWVQTERHASFRRYEQLDLGTSPDEVGLESEDDDGGDPDDPSSFANLTAGAVSRAPHSVDVGPYPGQVAFGGRTAVLHVLRTEV